MSESVTLKSYFYEVLIPSSQKNTSSPIEDILHHVSISFMKKLALYKCFNPRTHTGCDSNAVNSPCDTARLRLFSSVFSLSSSSSSKNPSVNIPMPVCKDWFFFSKRSATEKDNCPIVTALCILMKAAYAFRLHLLKRSACERYVYDFLIL